MKAAVYYGPGDLRIEERPQPEPVAGEILLRILLAGVCGTDAAEFRDGPHLVPLCLAHPVTGHVGPMILGHEFLGEVVHPGDSAFVHGQRVVSGAGISCGTCARCREGRTNLCVVYSTIGLHRDGGLAEYCTAPAAICAAVPDEMPSDAAAMAQPVAVASHAVNRGRVSSGEKVLVIGTGGIGCFLVHAAVAAGGQVTAVEPDPARRVLAGVAGAQEVLDVSEPVIPGYDVVFEVSGSEAGMRAAMAAVRLGGRLVLVGLQHAPAEALVSASLREIELIGTNALVFAKDIPNALRLLSGSPDFWSAVAPVIHPLDEVVESVLIPLSQGRSGQIKNLIDPTIDTPRPYSRGVPATGTT